LVTCRDLLPLIAARNLEGRKRVVEESQTASPQAGGSTQLDFAL